MTDFTARPEFKLSQVRGMKAMAIMTLIDLNGSLSAIALQSPAIPSLAFFLMKNALSKIDRAANLFCSSRNFGLDARFFSAV